jgi:hypothetical protein
MRSPTTLLFVCLVALTARAQLPDAVRPVIDNFRTDGARGWAYTQTNVAEGRKTIERFDPGQPEFVRWTLLETDGRVPTSQELQHYRERRARRVQTASPPPLKEQLDLTTAELLEETAAVWRYRFHLKPGGEDDRAAIHMRATLVIHKASGTIEELAIASIEPFSPGFLIKVEEMRTVMTYSLAVPGEPSHLLRVEVRVRGRAILKAIDQHAVVTYSDFAPMPARRQ